MATATTEAAHRVDRGVPDVIDALEADWVTDRRTRRPPAAWQHERALQGHTPAKIVDDSRDPRCREQTDAALAVLVRRAKSDELAALTAMHMLLPAAKTFLVRSHAGAGTEGRALAVIEDLWRIIRLYPCQRPGRVAANVKLELLSAQLAEQYGPIRNNRHRRHPVSVAATVALDTLDDQPSPAMSDTAASAGVELLTLLCQEVTAGRLNRRDASLIGCCRIADVTADEIGRRSGRQPQSVRRSRQRAEDRLRHAVVTAAA